MRVGTMLRKQGLAVVALAVMLGAPTMAQAGRGRWMPASEAAAQARERNNVARAEPPATPEPAGALSFAAGLGVLAWTLRRRSR